MAIHLQCPRCMHEQKIDDDKAGKEVPCKICHHLFTPGKSAPTQEKSNGKPAAEKKASPAGVKAGLPSAQTGKKKAADDDADARPKKKSKEPDDDRPTSRARNESGGSGVMMYVLIGGGAFLLLALLCGGGSLGALVLFRSGDANGEQIAQIDGNQPPPPGNNDANNVMPPPPAGNPNNNAPVNPPPNPVVDPAPVPIQPPPPPPPPEKLDPGNPRQLDLVLNFLKGPAQEKSEAFTWLKDANPNHPRRADAARVLDGMVQDYTKGPPFGNDPLFTAYFKWAGKENADTLLQLAGMDARSPANARYRTEAVRLLTTWKDARVVTLMVKKLENFFERGNATTALIEIGPFAESAVLPYYNHSDGGVRASARQAIQAYKTRGDAILSQCMTDLNSNDGNRRNGALQGIASCDVDNKRKAEISKALNGMIQNEGSLRNRDLVAALEKYGTSDNAAKLIEILEQNRLRSTETIRVLGKLRDPNGTDAIARQVGNFFNNNEAKNALKEAGAMAEPAVIKAIFTGKDGRNRTEQIRFLGEIGTRKLSLPFLQKLAFAFQMDRRILPVIQQSIIAINARGK